MALWQFQMLMVPQELVGGRQKFTADELKAMEWCQLRQPPTDYCEQFAAILPRVDCPLDEHAWWGTNAGNNIEVSTNNSIVESIIIRVDCRDFEPTFSCHILDIATTWNCRLIYRRYFTVMPYDNRAFIEAIMRSPNRQFMIDPEYWLPKIDAEVNGREGTA